MSSDSDHAERQWRVNIFNLIGNASRHEWTSCRSARASERSNLMPEFARHPKDIRNIAFDSNWIQVDCGKDIGEPEQPRGSWVNEEGKESTRPAGGTPVAWPSADFPLHGRTWALQRKRERERAVNWESKSGISCRDLLWGLFETPMSSRDTVSARTRDSRSHEQQLEENRDCRCGLRLR